MSSPYGCKGFQLKSVAMETSLPNFQGNETFILTRISGSFPLLPDGTSERWTKRREKARKKVKESEKESKNENKQ